MEVLASTAVKLTACEEESCEPLQWQGSPQLLALAALSVVLHESGLREDIQFGRPPRGRGPAGEACLMQLDARDAPVLATWLPREERQRDKKKKDEREAFAQTLLGDSPEALGRCLEVGMRMLARARRSCGQTESWKHGMFSMYGTGTTCNASTLRGRTETYQRLIARSRALQAAARPEPRMVN
jgi:hypothetical protein